MAVLWVALFLLGVLATGLRWSDGLITVVVAGTLVFAVGRYTPLGAQVVGAHVITWMLLLSGVRRVLEIGALSSDGVNLSQLTMIPRVIWYLLWLAVSLGALALGGKMLVMPN